MSDLSNHLNLKNSSFFQFNCFPISGHSPPSQYKALSSFFSGLAFISFLFPLVLYAITGYNARFVQNDYCYAVHLRSHGLWASWWHAYLNPTPFSGNRVSLTFFLDLTQTLGSSSVSILPSLMILIWLGGMALLFQSLKRLLNWQIPLITSLALSTGVIAFTLSQAPNLTQVLYWRPGMLPYLAPLVLTTWVLFLIVSQAANPFSGWVTLLTGLLAGVAGGFSETAAAFNTGLFSILLLVSWFGMRQGHTLARRSFFAIWFTLLGSLLAMLVLILSPAARLRQEALFPQPPGFVDLLKISLESTRFFVVHSLYRVTLPSLAVGGLAFCLAAWNTMADPPSSSPSLLQFGYRTLAAAVSAFILLMCIMAPSTYAEGTYPEARVLLMARLVFVIFTGLLGWWAGALFSTWSHGQNPGTGLLMALAATFLIGLLAFPTMAVVEPPYPELRNYFQSHPVICGGIILGGLWMGVVLSRWRKPSLHRIMLGGITLVFLFQPILDGYQAWFALPDFELRARMWDFRDGQIRQMASAGEQHVTVQALDSLAGITELQENPSHWVNNCAAAYYGVHSIRAIEPILNPPVHR